MLTDCLDFAGIAGDVHGDSSLMSKDHLNFTLKQPYGVVAAFIPWNVPILMALNKIAPAVAAGNAIIVRHHAYQQIPHQTADLDR